MRFSSLKTFWKWQRIVEDSGIDIDIVFLMVYM